MNLFDPSVMIDPPKPLVPQFFAAQAEAYRKFQNQCYDDGYNKLWNNWLQGSHIELPTTNEASLDSFCLSSSMFRKVSELLN